MNFGNNMKKLNITFCSFPDYAGNAKALYDYMKDRYDFNYTWIVIDEKSVEVLKKENVNCILIGTEEFEKYIPKNDIFFTTHANLAGDKLKAKKSIYVELWHGIGVKPVGFLSEKISENDDKWYNYVREVIDYIIVPTKLWQSVFSAMFNINPTRILPIGIPMFDEIKNADGKNNLSKVLKTDVSKYNKIIMYMPTFKKGCGRELESKYNENNVLNFYDYSDDKLVKYLQDNNYLLIVKRHPSDECIYSTIENDYIKNIYNDMLIENGFNINSILNAGDLLITDYSSLGLEFSFLDRPTIYVATDLEEYKNNRGIIFDDYDFWTEGNYCFSYSELIDKINYYFAGNKYEYNNKNLIYGSLKDGGCEQICNYFFLDNNINKNNVKQYKSIKFEQEKIIDELEEMVHEQKSTIKKLMESDIELNRIINSKGYKYMVKLRKIKNKITFNRK